MPWNPTRNQHLPARRPFRPWLTWILAGAACGLLFWPSASLALEERNGISLGVWRCFTGHLTHRSLPHLILNLGLFLPLAWLRERRRGAALFCLEYLCLAIAVTVGLRALPG